MTICHMMFETIQSCQQNSFTITESETQHSYNMAMRDFSTAIAALRFQHQPAVRQL